MKITIYTIKDCTFSKQEKEYLNTNKLVFEEKDLETNKDFLTEMLAISNNFAGTPVTRVEKDDGTIAVLKGFTKEEFDKTFGLASPELKAEAGSTVPPPVNDTPIPLITEVPPAEPVSPTPVPAESPAAPDPLKSVMDDLQAKAEPITPVVEEPPDSPAVVSTEAGPTNSTVPTPPPAGAPTIPDFPTK